MSGFTLWTRREGTSRHCAATCGASERSKPTLNGTPQVSSKNRKHEMHSCVSCSRREKPRKFSVCNAIFFANKCRDVDPEVFLLSDAGSTGCVEASNYGDCEQLCLPSGGNNQKRCACATGFELNDDETSCKGQ